MDSDTKTNRAMKKKPIGEYPVLKGIVDHNRRVTVISVWCPFCKHFHTHGWEDSWYAKRYGTHRVAHCTVPDSPFKQGGYFVKEFTKKERAEILDVLSFPKGIGAGIE